MSRRKVIPDHRVDHWLGAHDCVCRGTYELGLPQDAGGVQTSFDEECSVMQIKAREGKMSLEKSKKFTLLASLYLAQGLPFGFFTQALPVLLRKADLSLTLIGSANLLTLPWALKFLWAPAVDRWHMRSVGLRRSWLIPLQLISVLTFAGLSLVTPRENLLVVLVAFLITNLIAASQDIATDGLALDLLSREDRGWANGVQVAAYRVGMVIGGGVLLWLFDKTSWPAVMLMMSLVALICTIPVWRLREPAPQRLRPEAKSLRDVIREIAHFCLKPGARSWLVVLVLYKAGHYLATGMLRPWLVDAHYSLTDIALMLGSFGFGAGFVGAMLGGWCASRFDRRRLLILFGLFETLAVASYLWPVSSGDPSLIKIAVAISLDHFSSGTATAVLFTMMMDACSSDRAASDYTFQSCVVVAATGAAATLSGKSADTFGYAIHFAISGAFALAALAITAFVLRRPSVHSLLAGDAS